MDDLTALAPVLERISYLPERTHAVTVPWPAAYQPRPAATPKDGTGALPACDVVVITWTAAEAAALALLTPGLGVKDWTRYTHQWAAYETQLTTSSPARNVHRLGEFHLCTIGKLRVLLLHSQLHPATDARSLPAAQLAGQAARETGARLVITTGTAGGGPGTVLGDVIVATAIHSDCTTRLAGQPWSRQQWNTAALTAGQQRMLDPAVTGPLLAPNAARLPAEYTPRAIQIQFGHCVSVDYFAFYSRDDHYGLLAYDPQLKCEEMDDFAVAVGVGGAAEVASVRCASDPPMPDGSEASKQLAESIYRQDGYTAALGSVITSWALIAGLAG